MTNDTASLVKVAAEEYENANHDFAAAETSLTNRLMDDLEFLLSAVAEISHNAMRAHRRKIREKYFEWPKTEPSSLKDVEIAEAMKRPYPWYDYPLSTGKLLGKATKGELVDEADMHKAMASGNLRMMRIYTDIVKRLPNEKTKVSTVFSESDLEEIAKNRS